MNIQKNGLLFVGCLVGLMGFVTGVSEAGVSVRITSNYDSDRDYAPSYYHPRRAYYARRAVYRPVVRYRPGVHETIGVPVSYVSTTYASDLARFRERVSQQRAVIDTQYRKGSLTPDQYEDAMNALESIERTERAQSYERGGYLSNGELIALNRRVDDVSGDIDRYLSE